VRGWSSTVQSRLKLIDELWESVVNDLNDPAKPSSLPISEATRALLEERRREYRADHPRRCAGKTCARSCSR
jgi:hypothetical protein